MKRWIHATSDPDHLYHIQVFNDHYSENVPNRVVKRGKVYFTDPYPVSQLIKSYNKKHKDARLDLKTELSDEVDENGNEFAHFIVI